MPYYTREQLDQTNLHFIIGSNRSGTTLLTTILNAHPQVLSTPESRLTLTFYPPYAHQNPISEQFITDLADYTQLSIFNRVKSQQGTQQLIGDLDKEVFLSFDAQQLAKLNYAALSKLLLLNILLPNKDYSGINTIVDKNPGYTFYVERLMKLYPNAKFIVAMRDYRAIVLSHKESIATALVLANRKKKDKLSSSIINAYKWNMYNREVLRLQKLYSDKLLVVSYENMVQQTETTVRQACQFLGVPFLPSMLSPHQRLTPQTPTESTDQRDQKRATDLARPINTNRLAAWETKLSATEISAAEILCAQTGKQFGYQPTQNISLGQRLLFYLRHAYTLLWLGVVRSGISHYHFYLPIKWRLLGLKFVNRNKK